MDPYLGKPFAEVAVAGEPELEQAIQGAARLRNLRSSAGVSARICFTPFPHWSKPIVMISPTGWCRNPKTHRRQSAGPTGSLPLSASAPKRLCVMWRIRAVDLSARNKNFRALYERFPIGPISAITPFNFPLNLSAHNRSRLRRRKSWFSNHRCNAPPFSFTLPGSFSRRVFLMAP